MVIRTLKYDVILDTRLVSESRAVDIINRSQNRHRRKNIYIWVYADNKEPLALMKELEEEQLKAEKVSPYIDA